MGIAHLRQIEADAVRSRTREVDDVRVLRIDRECLVVIVGRTHIDLPARAEARRRIEHRSGFVVGAASERWNPNSRPVGTSILGEVQLSRALRVGRHRVDPVLEERILERVAGERRDGQGDAIAAVRNRGRQGRRDLVADADVLDQRVVGAARHERQTQCGRGRIRLVHARTTRNRRVAERGV